MKNWVLILFAVSILAFSGCGNLSPQNKQRLENQNGRIGAIENNQQGLKLELGKLQNQAEIQNSKLDRYQQGLANLQSNNENTGVQILSGTGGLMVAALVAFAAVVIAMAYRNEAVKQKKAVEILAQEVAQRDDPDLEENIFKACMHTNAEEAVHQSLTKHQRIIQQIKALKVNEKG